ncbi:MAG: hypothetical protein J0M26_21910 [Planctomycetes bacterium]|nr:hypothetical protein [Planctomycetota bacterium]
MRLLALAALCLTFIAGCQPSAGTIPVKGKLTLKGAPAPEGTLVSFVPVGGGETATGKVKAGEYELFSGVRGDVGAKPGKYKVVIAAGTSPDMGAYENMKKPKKDEAPGSSTGDFPKEYATAETSPLEKEVASGANYDIDIP